MTEALLLGGALLLSQAMLLTYGLRQVHGRRRGHLLARWRSSLASDRCVVIGDMALRRARAAAKVSIDGRRGLMENMLGICALRRLLRSVGMRLIGRRVMGAGRGFVGRVRV